MSAGSRAPATTFLPFPPGRRKPVACFSDSNPLKMRKRSAKAVTHDPLAGLIGGFEDHVHAMRVAGKEPEVHDHFAAQRVALHAQQFAVPRG